MSSPRSMFCSESIARCMQWAGHPDARSFSPEETTPQELLTFYRRTDRGTVLDTKRWS